MITICFTYFKSLTLANLAAALYSVRRQDLSRVESIVVVDNDSADATWEIQDIVDGLDFPARLLSFKHGDPARTHSWSTNVAVREAGTSWVLFTRADYILYFDALGKFVRVVESKPDGWDGFITGNGRHLHVDVTRCEASGWRERGAGVLRQLPGVDYDYTLIDAGVWMARRSAFDRVGGLDESLTAWGHAQTDFQHRLYKTGTEFVRVPEVLFYHPAHGGEKDIELAHRQLRDKGGDLKEMWARYEGVSPY